VRFIQNAFHALKQTFIPDNVKNAFKMLGLEFDVTQTPYNAVSGGKVVSKSGVMGNLGN
jgi:hypothetical protein